MNNKRKRGKKKRKTLHKKGAGGVAQGVDSKFKPQSCKKKKNR
jgi:hypothetical protein